MIKVGSMEWTNFEFVVLMSQKQMEGSISLLELVAITSLVYPKERASDVVRVARGYLDYSEA